MLIRPKLSGAIRAVPLPIAQRVATLLFDQFLTKHPALFDRLGCFETSRFAFIPNELPFAFLICPAKKAIQTYRRGARLTADATIEGPFFLLLALAEGRVDGDALFFSRRLTVTGNMEAVLALRNALDDNNIDLAEDFANAAGPLQSAAKVAIVFLRKHALRAEGLAWN
ncbi:ubiquinone anaerobic biosynthesis accessory factor UbiT [Rhizobium mayense]|uniref:SCP2 sterol-binding domain-containing protein n=1 Tax=Rhizobium mayense TaxID=1312184 RepID=A0ABT7K6T1_9HYPH|nr:SCP2 sterol-binding domain-containing protein [Rhizobium mayense]MDL2403877.1 SCP2 sterol-binding domain-containing protein [Rhizobium mayense]